jgi:outer membrane cobalamin receptor
VDEPRPRFENLYNPWVLLPELHADRVGLSPDKARARGAELTLRYRFSETLSAAAGYAHANTEERLQGNWRPRPWDQHQAARLSVQWQQGQWQLSATGAWHGGWPNTSRLTEPPSSSLRLYDRELPDYFSLDLHVARRFDLKSSKLEVYLDLTNSTFRKNVGGYRYEQSDKGIVADDRHLLPTFPALGVAWNW